MKGAGRPPLSTPPARVDVLRLSSLGDVILALPIVAAVKAAWPETRVRFWVKEEFAGVLRHDPAIAHVRELERDARQIEDLVSMSAELEDTDLVLDLHGSIRTRVLTFRVPAPVRRAASYRLRREQWVRARWTRPTALPHAIERYGAVLRPFGLTPLGAPRVHAGSEAEAWAEAWLGPARASIALCPGAAHATKRWPLERWLALDAALGQAGFERVIIGTAGERRVFADLVDEPGRRWCVEPLDRVAAVLSRCRVAVTHDSGLMHLAAARGSRVVALFGSTSPVLGFAPSGEGHEVLCRNLSCQPCTLHGRPACPLRHHRCMTEIGMEEVLGRVQRLVAESPP